jgi:uncharacterized protein involved in high-affinity Fe2+ transport
MRHLFAVQNHKTDTTLGFYGLEIQIFILTEGYKSHVSENTGPGKHSDL